MRSSRTIVLLAMALTLPVQGLPAEATVELLRLPAEELKPRVAVGEDGTLHLVVYVGELKQGDLFYKYRAPGADEFSPPVRINDEAGSVNGRGPITSPHMAIGKAGRIHVAYPRSHLVEPAGPWESPGILHARLNDEGSAFEPATNLMRRTRGGPFGGQSIAADDSGNVWVSWYGVDGPRGTEAEARLWVARSSDEGRSFEPEEPVVEEVLGACYCCAMSALATPGERLLLFYRAAGDRRHRDMHLFVSDDHGASYRDIVMQRWDFVGCPETGGFLGMAGAEPLAVWEAEQKRLQIARLPSPGSETEPTTLVSNGRMPPRFPVAATNASGETLVVWTENVTAKRGGQVLFQLLDPAGRPIGKRGKRFGVKPNSFVAVVAREDGSFLIVL